MNNTKFELWSPPTFDLSLDSFSNEIFQEFDKNRDSSHEPQIHSQEPATITTETIETHRNKYDISSSPVSSSVTLPQSEREEEDTTSTANLFRKSSTFLKQKLSLINHDQGSNRDSAATNLSSQQVEDISGVISRQYPPKPLHYSPVVDPPSDDVGRVTVSSSPSNSVQPEERKAVRDRALNAPKRRSFFSLRFC